MKLILLMSIIVLTATSCSKKINLRGHYDPTKSFEVYEHTVDTKEFLVNKVRHTQLLSWLESNNKNWKPTRNDWGSLVIIKQDNFDLMLYRNGERAVVGITDDKNITRYYIRTFDNDGLKFLDK